MNTALINANIAAYELLDDVKRGAGQKELSDDVLKLISTLDKLKERFSKIKSAEVVYKQDIADWIDMEKEDSDYLLMSLKGKDYADGYKAALDRVREEIMDVFI